MTSPQDLYRDSNQSPQYYDGVPSPTVTRGSHSPGPSWVPPATTGDQSGYSQVHQSGNLFNTAVGINVDDAAINTLSLSDLEDMSYSFHHPQPNYHPQGTSFQVPHAQPDPQYNVQDGFNLDLVPFSYDNFPSTFYRHSYPPSGSSHSFPGPSSANHAFRTNEFTGMLGLYGLQDVYEVPTSQGPPGLGYQSSSLTQLPLMGHGGPAPVYGGDSGSVQPTAARLELDEINTAMAELANAGAGKHSHASPVAISPSNQIPAAGSSRPPQGSPERKRLLSLSAEEELSTARNVVPRSGRAWSVHSTSSDSHRRNRILDIPGRGPVIPQDRYTTSSVSTFNTTHITFNLENPDQTGIPIVDILNKTGSFNRIRDRTQAFDHMAGKKTFTLRVQWPGYKTWCKTIAALNWKKSREPITRVKLAEDVATAIRDLLQKKRDEPFDPDYAAWNLGPNGIRLDQLCLVALHHVSKGSWQPQLCLLQPSQH